jgi:hypothetical protein
MYEVVVGAGRITRYDVVIKRCACAIRNQYLTLNISTLVKGTRFCSE